MGLGKPSGVPNLKSLRLLRKYKEICFQKFGKTKMGKPLILGGKPTLPLDSQSQCFLFTVQLLWSYDYSKWVIFTKNRILQ